MKRLEDVQDICDGAHRSTACTFLARSTEHNRLMATTGSEEATEPSLAYALTGCTQRGSAPASRSPCTRHAHRTEEVESPCCRARTPRLAAVLMTPRHAPRPPVWGTSAYAYPPARLPARASKVERTCMAGAALTARIEGALTRLGGDSSMVAQSPRAMSGRRRQ